MSTVPTELARHVADNPTDCDVSDLEAFLNYVGQGDKPAPMAAAIWPNNEVEAIPGYSHDTTNPINRIPTLVKLRDYVKRSILARKYRGDGMISIAMKCEEENERVYKSLPNWAKW